MSEGIDALDGGPARGVVVLGDDVDAVSVTVRPLLFNQIAPFTRAIEPVLGLVAKIMAEDAQPSSLLAAVRDDIDSLRAALAAATTRFAKGDSDEVRTAKLAEREDQIAVATLEQTLELLVAVILANKDFLRGRLRQMLQVAKAARPGAGPTPSSLSSALDSLATT